MRFTVTFTSKSEITLPFEHNHLLQAAIYQQIEQPGLRHFLHEQGFALGQRKFKLFTFSRLLGQVRVDPRRQEMVFSPPCRLVVCSPIPMVVEEIAKGLLTQGRVRLGKATLFVESVMVSDPIVSRDKLTIRMLSPVTVYSTIEEPHRRYTYYYSPYEPRFQELIGSNLAKKYQLIFGRAADTTGFSISPLKVGEKDLKIVKYKGTIIKGWMGIYELTGDPQLLEIALNAGLGSKNSQGFGCCEVVEEPATEVLYN